MKLILRNITIFTLLILILIGGISNNLTSEEINQVNDNLITNEQEDPWPMFRHDLKHTGRTKYTGPQIPEIAWDYKTDDGIVSSAAIASDGTIYVGSGWNKTPVDPYFFAFNPDGFVKWKYDTNNGYFSSPTIAEDGTVYVISYNGFLLSLTDKTTYAKLNWKSWLSYFFNLCSPMIAEDGIIHVGSPSFLYLQLYPNGLKRFRYETDWCIISSAAIDDDGTVYIGSKDHHLYAFIPDKKLLKWKFAAGEFFDGHCVDSSPAIGDDGTIYFGTDTYGAAGQTPVNVTDNFWAVNPDGSLKWFFETEDGVESSPAIGYDGSVYFGSYDGYLYAVEDKGDYGELKWKFKTEGAIDGSPIVDADGVIYFASRDSYVYALYPDGSLNWKFKGDDGFESSPSIDDKGYLYIGSFGGTFYCLGTGNPDVGVASIDLSKNIPPGSTVYPKATITNFRAERQEFNVTCIIEYDGEVIYTNIGKIQIDGGTSKEIIYSAWELWDEYGFEYNLTITTSLLNDENPNNNNLSIKIITSDNMPPETPTINGPTIGNKGRKYKYVFCTDDTDEDLLYYFIDWGDNTPGGWLGPYKSGHAMSTIHSWSNNGTYEIRIKSKDILGQESNWGILEVTMPRSGLLTNGLFMRLFERFPNAFPILRYILGL